MIKKILNLVPVAFYVLFESIFVGAIISTLWFFGFKELREQLPIEINFYQIVGVVWSLKLILNNVLSIAITSTIDTMNPETKQE